MWSYVWKSVLFFLFLVFFSTQIFSQQTFELSGEFRPRIEQRHGYRSLSSEDSKSALFVSERLRLNVLYSYNYVKMYMSLQDVRTWGNEEQLKNVGSFGLHEGWAEIGIKDKAFFKFGRQEIIYDDHRLMGNVDWVQNGRAHDGMIIKVRHKKSSLDLGGAFNQVGEPLTGTVYKLNNYKALAYAWFNQKLDSNRLSLSFYAISDGIPNKDSIPITFFRVTTGPYLGMKYKHFNGSIAAFMQTGRNLSNKNIMAYMATFYGEYVHPKFSAGLGYDYVSGNNASDASNDKSRTFNTLYATNHKFYGHMDYFLDLPADTKGGGLQDAFFRLNYKPKPKGSAGFDVHYFLLGNKVADALNPGDYLKLSLGFELDLYGIYKPLDFMELKAGYSIMLATTSMEAIKGGSKDAYQGWSFVMLTLKPSMFKWIKSAEEKTN